MRKLAITVALASTALATPAVAKDHSVYVGLEGGVMWVEDSPFDITDGRTNPQFTADHKTGYDVDAIAGYDFGAVRLEAELGYKRAAIDTLNTLDTTFPADGHASALSLMANVLFDFGDENGLSGYAGGGIGVARTKYDFDAPALFSYVGPVISRITTAAWPIRRSSALAGRSRRTSTLVWSIVSSRRRG